MFIVSNMGLICYNSIINYNSSIYGKTYYIKNAFNEILKG